MRARPAVRVLTTLLRPDSGSAHVAGVDVLADPARARTVMGLAGQYAARRSRRPRRITLTELTAVPTSWCILHAWVDLDLDSVGCTDALKRTDCLVDRILVSDKVHDRQG